MQRAERIDSKFKATSSLSGILYDIEIMSDFFYLLDRLGRDNGRDCASLLHHHSLLMARIDWLAMQVASCGLSVCLQKHNVHSDKTGPLNNAEIY